MPRKRRAKKFSMPAIHELRQRLTSPVRNREVFIKDALREFENKELVEPYYQREFVWPFSKQLDFLRFTLETQQIVMPIVTYSLENKRATFLQDGKQRLTTLSRAVNYPENFGLQPEHVTELLQTGISIRHCSFDDHDQGRIGFQKLNSNTGLAPYDLWRGEIDRTETGKVLYDAVKNGVHYVASKLAGTDFSRKRDGQLHRGALALFYMFENGKPRRLEILTHGSDKNKQPEVLVAKLIAERGWAVDDAIAAARTFCRYLESLAALVQDVVTAVAPDNCKKMWDEQAVRGLFNAGVYVRLHPGLHTEDFRNAVEWYVRRSRGFSKFVSRFDIGDSSNRQTMRMSQFDVKWLRYVAIDGGPDLITPRPAAPIAIRPKIGNDVSHVVPISLGGQDTVLENSLTNRARGNREMTAQELAALTSPPQISASGD